MTASLDGKIIYLLIISFQYRSDESKVSLKMWFVTINLSIH